MTGLADVPVAHCPVGRALDPMNTRVPPARVAARKGHSFIGFFVFSLFFFPAAIIVAYVVRDRRVAN